jgi:hypothetical protein
LKKFSKKAKAGEKTVEKIHKKLVTMIQNMRGNWSSQSKENHSRRTSRARRTIGAQSPMHGCCMNLDHAVLKEEATSTSTEAKKANL